MARTAEQYKELLKALLPPGEAFPRDTSKNMDDLLAALAEEWARIEGRGENLIVESLPATANELLSDWERVAGLPDKCAGTLETTMQGRRNALVSKLTSTGGQSREYFIAVAKALGYTITISEFRPFRAGWSKAGDPLTNGDWIYAWQVNAPETTIISFRAGQSGAGEALRTWGNDTLECKINQLKPAHTIAIFTYGLDLVEGLIGAADEFYYAMNYTVPEDIA